MQTSDFNYHLPQELIAQVPVEPRDSSRLMQLEIGHKAINHYTFRQLPQLLKEGDLLVFNDSRVIPARVLASRALTGGHVEILLLKRTGDTTWEAMVKPAKRLRKGTVLKIKESDIEAEIIEELDDGVRVIRFPGETSIGNFGEVALPPYIVNTINDTERYQTVYSQNLGSVAAPTSGLHFTDPLLQKIRSKGIEALFVTLHIGLDTFRPVKSENPAEHQIHTEYGAIEKNVAEKIKAAKKKGRRVIAVGTSTARLLEHAAGMEEFKGWVDIYILSGYKFKVLDGIITNFHLPRSTLLMMVSAFAGKEFIFKAYKEAIAKGYRFYSFGDAMIII